MKEWCSGEKEVLGRDLRDLSHSHSSLCVCVCVCVCACVRVCGGGEGEGRSDYQLRIQNIT